VKTRNAFRKAVIAEENERGNAQSITEELGEETGKVSIEGAAPAKLIPIENQSKAEWKSWQSTVLVQND
jgi:hypothetical protein